MLLQLVQKVRQLHYSPENKQNLSQPANQMPYLFVFSLNKPQMSHSAKRQLPISGAN